jgi:ABC-type phosphate transport system permease subunit
MIHKENHSKPHVYAHNALVLFPIGLLVNGISRSLLQRMHVRDLQRP